MKANTSSPLVMRPSQISLSAYTNRIWITQPYLPRSKDSLAATSLGFCVGTNQQWVYAYTDSPPNAFTTVDDAVRSASGIDLFETGDHETITSTLTSGRPAPALSLLAQNTDLIAEILTKRF